MGRNALLVGNSEEELRGLVQVSLNGNTRFSVVSHALQTLRENPEVFDLVIVDARTWNDSEGPLSRLTMPVTRIGQEFQGEVLILTNKDWACIFRYNLMSRANCTVHVLTESPPAPAFAGHAYIRAT